MQVTHGHFPEITRSDMWCPGPLKTLVESCLVKDSKGRPSAEALLSCLQLLLRDLTEPSIAGMPKVVPVVPSLADELARLHLQQRGDALAKISSQLSGDATSMPGSSNSSSLGFGLASSSGGCGSGTSRPKRMKDAIKERYRRNKGPSVAAAAETGKAAEAPPPSPLPLPQDSPAARFLTEIGHSNLIAPAWTQLRIFEVRPSF